MDGVWILLLFGAFVIVVPIIATKLPLPGAKAQLDR